jgi:FtsP/CotA-like multicopper oxidase with cupredoxin domain
MCGALVGYTPPPPPSSTAGVLFGASRALASVGQTQTPLPGSGITKFVEPLPTFVGQRVSATSINVGMSEFQQRILPDAIYSPLAAPFNAGTYLWGYSVQNANGGTAQPSYPGLTIEATKGTPTTVRYTNNLPTDPVLRKYLTIDQTLHWADPLGQGHVFVPYTGPIPTVVHLHGAEDQSTSDGAPEAWFTSGGLHGPGYFTQSPTAPNSAVYFYPNGQEATTLWFHNHSLGITRINVYSGLTAMYLIRDQFDTGKKNSPLNLPAGAQEIELLIQDRGFDTNGQMLFPDSAANPAAVDGPPSNPKIHPFWIPEFFGDTMVVNGRTWPFLSVEPRRYRFRIVNASNARFVRMGLVDRAGGAVGPAIFQIGTDGGLLDRPVKLEGRPEPVNQGVPTPTSRLFLAPSERADIIIDFAGLQGKSFNLDQRRPGPVPEWRGARPERSNASGDAISRRSVIVQSGPDLRSVQPGPTSWR